MFVSTGDDSATDNTGAEEGKTDEWWDMESKAMVFIIGWIIGSKSLLAWIATIPCTYI